MAFIRDNQGNEIVEEIARFKIQSGSTTCPSNFCDSNWRFNTQIITNGIISGETQVRTCHTYIENSCTDTLSGEYKTICRDGFKISGTIDSKIGSGKLQCEDIRTQICGNNIPEGTEECDGNDSVYNHRGKTCQDFNIQSGDLKCNSQCKFDLSQCEANGDGDDGDEEQGDGGTKANGEVCTLIEDTFLNNDGFKPSNECASGWCKDDPLQNHGFGILDIPVLRRILRERYEASIKKPVRTP